MKVKSVLVALALAIPLQAALCQEYVAENGNWWLGQSRAQHVSFIWGFYEGMDLGRNFSFWKYNEKEAAVIGSQVSTSYNEMGKRYMTGVTAGQIIDGLDVFYSDYRNRSIKVHDAVWLVLRQIAGETNLNVENWRKNANY
jgi:hypothetical protein